MKVTIAGAEVLKPSLTVLELINDGTRPIASSDFEGPIDLFATNDSVISRAAVTQARPKDLDPKLTVENGRVRIAPMLLNPADTITIAVVASGPTPVLESRARIAGVTSVPVLDLNEQSSSSMKVFILIVASLLFFSAGHLVLDGWPSRGVALRPRAAFFLFVVCLFPAVVLLSLALDALHISGFWSLVGSFVGCMLVAGLVAGWINSRNLEKKASVTSGA